MRVIAGTKRGLKLYEPKGDCIRPTLDRVREDVFNIVSSIVTGSTFLDVFSGSGAVGIEAKSRGAKNITLVDNSKESCHLAKRNIEKCGFSEGMTILTKDAYDFLVQTRDKYDIIFLDPPYNFEGIKKCTDMVFSRHLLKEGGVMVLEQEKGSLWVQEAYSEKIIKTKKYSKTEIYFLEDK